MRVPHIEPGQAQTFLALVDHARGLVGEAAALPYLRGWLAARASEPVSQRRTVELGGFEAATDPRSESTVPPPGPAHAAALARVPLGRRGGT